MGLRLCSLEGCRPLSWSRANEIVDSGAPVCWVFLVVNDFVSCYQSDSKAYTEGCWLMGFLVLWRAPDPHIERALADAKR